MVFSTTGNESMFQSSRLLTEVPELIPSFRLTSKDLVYTTRVSRPSLMQIRLSVHLRLVVHGQRNDAQGSCGTRKRNILFRLVTIHMVLLHTYALYMNGGVVEYHLPTYSQLNTELVRGPMSGMAFNRPHRSCSNHKLPPWSTEQGRSQNLGGYFLRRSDADDSGTLSQLIILNAGTECYGA